MGEVYAVSRAVHFSHTACADERNDLVRAKPSASRERHEKRLQL
jgi:hypothetical protein